MLRWWWLFFALSIISLIKEFSKTLDLFNDVSSKSKSAPLAVFLIDNVKFLVLDDIKKLVSYESMSSLSSAPFLIPNYSDVVVFFLYLATFLSNLN